MKNRTTLAGDGTVFLRGLVRGGSASGTCLDTPRLMCMPRSQRGRGESRDLDGRGAREEEQEGGEKEMTPYVYV
jgi:hypothetical protein